MEKDSSRMEVLPWQVKHRAQLSHTALGRDDVDGRCVNFGCGSDCLSSLFYRGF